MVTFFNKYLMSVVHKEGLEKQFIFNLKECNTTGFNDPLNEDVYSPSKGLIHRYPDRVLLTITNRCFAYCRFCFRKKNWSHFPGFDLSGAVKYISDHKEIREVLISGGDPFTLSIKHLESILKNIRNIKHIEVIRIGTRVLTSNPIIVTHDYVDIIKNYKPIWIVAHINHPDEITPEFADAAEKIVNSGIPILSQTVLLNGINNDKKTLKRLFCKLAGMGIKPYYLFGCDQAVGNRHFRVSIDEALEIMRSLRCNISGICMPAFAFDLPNGGGKVVLEPETIVSRQNGRYILKNFEGRRYIYEDV